MTFGIGQSTSAGIPTPASPAIVGRTCVCPPGYSLDGVTGQCVQRATMQPGPGRATAQPGPARATYQPGPARAQPGQLMGVIMDDWGLGGVGTGVNAVGVAGCNCGCKKCQHYAWTSEMRAIMDAQGLGHHPACPHVAGVGIGHPEIVDEPDVLNINVFPRSVKHSPCPTHGGCYPQGPTDEDTRCFDCWWVKDVLGLGSAATAAATLAALAQAAGRPPAPDADGSYRSTIVWYQQAGQSALGLGPDILATYGTSGVQPYTLQASQLNSQLQQVPSAGSKYVNATAAQGFIKAMITAYQNAINVGQARQLAPRAPFQPRVPLRGLKGTQGVGSMDGEVSFGGRPVQGFGQTPSEVGSSQGVDSSHTGLGLSPTIARCPAGYSWSVPLGKCVQYRLIGGKWVPHTIAPDLGFAQAPYGAQVECPKGYAWNAHLGKCVQYHIVNGRQVPVTIATPNPFGITAPPAQGLGVVTNSNPTSPATVGLVAALGGTVGLIAGAALGSEVGPGVGETAARRAAIGGLFGMLLGSFAGAAIAAPSTQAQGGA